MLQQGLLLLLGEVLDLVQVQENPVGGQKGVQLGDNFPDVRRSGRGGVEAAELPLGLLGDDIGHGGLAHPRGAEKIILGTEPLSMIRRSSPPGPRICRWP